jgi:glycosyltransferase involved in cell wall biosynthesis
MDTRPRQYPQLTRSPFPTVSVVVPVRNKARSLEFVLPAIAAVRPAVHEIIVADGNSPDGSLEAARRVLPWMRTITQTRKGKGNAMARGFAATGDVIVMFDADADGSANPAEISASVSALVAGARLRQGQPVHHRRQRLHHSAAPRRQRRAQGGGQRAVRHLLHRPVPRPDVPLRVGLEARTAGRFSGSGTAQLGSAGVDPSRARRAA